MKKVATVFINMVNNTFQPEFFLANDLAVGETINGFVTIISRGLFNEKGMKAINRYQGRKNN